MHELTKRANGLKYNFFPSSHLQAALMRKALTLGVCSLRTLRSLLTICSSAGTPRSAENAKRDSLQFSPAGVVGWCFHQQLLLLVCGWTFALQKRRGYQPVAYEILCALCALCDLPLIEQGRESRSFGTLRSAKEKEAK